MFERVKKVVKSIFKGPDISINKKPRVITKDEHHINPELVFWGAKKTCEMLQRQGYEAYIVGGAVRDLLLGVTPKDFDVATNATPNQVKKLKFRSVIIGRRFRLVHVMWGGEIVECSTFRALDAQGMRKDADGRVISDNVYGSMWEDAARRDFTINAMYYDPVSEEIYDYHHGFEDIAAKCVRMIGDPAERYREDPVRMMRAVRIASKLQFTMERQTEKAIPRMASLLENVPAARLFDEVMKLMTCGHAEECLVKLRKEKLHRSLLPMLDVILSEPEGEEFLMLALRRTDERIASGKKISPAFMFATLLWPQVKKRWDAYQQRGDMARAQALYEAADDVIKTQTAKLAIQNRFTADMKLIWMLQLRFERRTGKNPFTLVTHPKYRAGYDFMLLRSLLGHVPAEQVRWWEDFVAADSAERSAMVRAQQDASRHTADKAREGQKRAQREEQAEKEAMQKIAIERDPNLRRQKRREERRAAELAQELEGRKTESRFTQESGDFASDLKEEPSLAPEPQTAEAAPDVPAKKTRRRRVAKKSENIAPTEIVAAAESVAQKALSEMTVGAKEEVPAEEKKTRKPRRRKSESEQASTPQPQVREIPTESGEVLIQIETAKGPAPEKSVPEAPKKTMRQRKKSTSAAQKTEIDPSETTEKTDKKPGRRRSVKKTETKSESVSE